MLEAAIQQIDRCFRARDWRRGDDLGGVFTVVSGRFDLPEGEARHFYPDKDAAVAAWIEAMHVLGFARGEEPVLGRIVWRQRPLLEQHQGRWSVYSRLALIQ